MSAPKPNTTSAIAPSSLRLYGRNPRKGNVGVVAASLRAHGQYRPIVANIGSQTGRRFEVLAGNHTLKAYRQLAAKYPDDPRWSEILVFWVDVDEDAAKRIVLADNRTAELGDYDNTQLLSLIDEVGSDLEGIGFTASDIADLVGAGEREVAEIIVGDDDPDEDDKPTGRGRQVLAYAIVFDDEDQRRIWLDFTNWLRRNLPDLTVGERVTTYLEGHEQ